MNKTNALIVLFVFGWNSVSLAWAGDYTVVSREITFDVASQNVVGTLVMPSNIQKPPIILILSGMSGVRNGPPIRDAHQSVFEMASYEWAKRGMASLRISTRGREGSDGDFLDMTLEKRTEEALRAVDWIIAQERFDISSIYLLGHSQGTLIAAAAVKKASNMRKFKSVVLWAPQIDAQRTYKRAMGETIFQQGLNAKSGEIVTWRGSGGKLRAFRSGFFKTLADFHAGEDLKDFSGRVLIITGKRDRTSPTASAKAFSNFVKNLTFMEFDVGHRMGAELGRQEYNKVSEATLNWLEINQ